jgi:signal transduction histidine kinase
VDLSRIPIQRLAAGIAVITVGAGVLAPLLGGSQGLGLTLAVADGQVVVWTVDPFSPAQRFGFQAGMVAVELNGRTLIRLPQQIQPDPSPGTTPDPVTGDVPVPPAYIDPTTPQQVPLADSVLQGLVAQPLSDITAVRPGDLSTWTYDTQGNQVWIGDNGGAASLTDSLGTVVLGIGILFATAFWLTTGRAGAQLRDLGLPLALATAGPFLLHPFAYLWSPVAVLAAAVLLPAAFVPLGIKLVERIEQPQDRMLAAAAVAVCAGGSALLSATLRMGAALEVDAEPARLLVAGITLVPGIIAAGPAMPQPRHIGHAADADVAGGGRLLQSTELAVVGITPVIALLTGTSSVLVFLGWIVAILLAGRYTVRPLARVARRAQLQRDLVIAATEAERARVAADIHDDALQELTMLVRRLDSAGDAEGADVARSVSDRLRAICGDLRLPILDDLGVGPALDWLVLRMERLAGGEVRLERADGSRPPAEVELAFFRVAQEALANAVKHGRPPIVVRYRSSDGAASLSVDDAGDGIAPDAGERAEREGRFGLLNMQQRAEGVGAILDVRRWPKGGTHVQLEWRAR